MRVFLIIVAAIFASLAGGIAFLASVPKPSIPIAPAALMVIATWFSWGAVAIVSMLVLVGIIRGVWRHVGPVFGDSVAPRLLAFGATAVIFTNTVQSVLYPFLRFVVNLLMWVPTTLSKIPPSVALDTDPGHYMQSLPEGATSLASIIAVPFESFGRDLMDINFAWIFVAISAWAVVGQILTAYMRTEPGNEVHGAWPRLAERLRAAPAAAWQNALLFGVIMLGGLLSVSALITLPLLSQANPLSAEELKRIEGDFDSIVKIDDQSLLATPDLALPDSLSKDLDEIGRRISVDAEKQKSLLDKVKAASAPPQDPATLGAGTSATSGPLYTRSPPLTPDQALDLLGRLDTERTSIVRDNRSTWSEFQPSIKRSIDSSRSSALLAVRRQNYSPGGSGSDYVAQVSSWLNDSVQAQKNAADNCRSGLLRSIESYIDTAKTQLDNLENDFPVFMSSYRFRAFECTLGPMYRDQPEEHHLTLGAFGFSEWLIDLNSLPLTLIAGMLGFGLVGAAVSSVIRERKSRDPGMPLVRDITGILVRGLSATIVVYLAVKGGLVIFTAGSAGEPDPHVLLLTCLVASVFSEDVWAAARDRFLRKVRGNDASDASQDDSPGTPPPKN